MKPLINDLYYLPDIIKKKIIDLCEDHNILPDFSDPDVKPKFSNNISRSLELVYVGEGEFRAKCVDIDGLCLSDLTFLSLNNLSKCLDKFNEILKKFNSIFPNMSNPEQFVFELKKKIQHDKYYDLYSKESYIRLFDKEELIEFILENKTLNNDDILYLEWVWDNV